MWLVGAATGCIFLTIWYYVLIWMVMGMGVYIFCYGPYYTAMVLPTIWALFSIKSDAVAAVQKYDQNAMTEAQRMMNQQQNVQMVASVKY